MQVTSISKFHNIMLAILIVSSTFHLLIFRIAGLINIMLFDIVVFLYFIFLLPKILQERFDNWLKILIFLLFFQVIHNLLFTQNLTYVIKEFLQSSELIIFFLILAGGFSNSQNKNKIIEYVFYGLCMISLIAMSKYFFPFIPWHVDMEIADIGSGLFSKYIKASSVLNMSIPIFILSFFMISNSSSKTFKIIFFLIAIFSFYIGLFGSSRTFQMLILLIILDYFFNPKQFLKLAFISIAIFFTLVFYQDDISDKFNTEYKEKSSTVLEYLTNDESFTWLGHKQLMVIETPSNRERLHFLKLSYQTLNNNFFFGLGSKQVQLLTNLHGNFFVFLNSFGAFYLGIFCYLIYCLFVLSRRKLINNDSNLSRMKHYYLIYAIVSIMFVSAGNFPMLPLIIAAALIKSSNKIVNT